MSMALFSIISCGLHNVSSIFTPDASRSVSSKLLEERDKTDAPIMRIATRFPKLAPYCKLAKPARQRRRPDRDDVGRADRDRGFPPSNHQEQSFAAEQKRQILQLASDFPRLWTAQTAAARDRKRMLRLLIRDITVTKGQRLRTCKGSSE